MGAFSPEQEANVMRQFKQWQLVFGQGGGRADEQYQQMDRQPLSPCRLGIILCKEKRFGEGRGGGGFGGGPHQWGESQLPHYWLLVNYIKEASPESFT